MADREIVALRIQDGPAGLNRGRIDGKKVRVGKRAAQDTPVEIESPGRVGRPVSNPGDRQGSAI